jgi:hypothetical protein
VVFVSLNAQQLQVVALGLLKFRSQIDEARAELTTWRNTAINSDVILLNGTVRDMADALDGLAQTLQSAIGFAPVVTEEREEVGASV